MNIVKKSIDLNGKTLSLEYGRFAEQAGAAVVAQLGDTMVLATATTSSRDTSLSYFPLSVEYVERLYAGGRIKGSRWVKREGRPSDDAVLSARLIDRTIRPLFPKSYRRDVQIVVTLLSVDGEHDPDVLGLIATSAALTISPIPWNGPVAGIRMGYVKEGGSEEATTGLLVNPTASEQQYCEFDFVVAGPKDKVNMLEGGFCETPEDIVYESILEAKKINTKIIGCIEDLAKEVGKPKIVVEESNESEELEKKINKDYTKELKEIFAQKANKAFGDDGTDALVQQIAADYEEQYSQKAIESAIDALFKQGIRDDVLKNKKRIDGRAVDAIRDISGEVGILTRTHGSAMFRRGQTQVLTVATLGTPSLEQLIESPSGEESKRYMHHYTMPPYSVGETGRFGFIKRREIGHGALAEKGLVSVIPSEEEFPYTIRLVSEVMSSNGSTSMASTCGSTLALMDAGVPIKEPIAGISIGLVSDKNDLSKHVLLTDILGIEDFAGDMDFKVAGSKNGITAIQLDVKIEGLTDDMIKETLKLAKDARLSILKDMLAVIAQPRKKLSEFAPKIEVVKIPTEKIGEVIGPGGKVIKNIIASTGADVDVEDDGSVYISGIGEEEVKKAVEWVEGLTRELTPGEEFEGEVKRILAFGAFVEVLPGKEGMVHVSEMSTEYVKDPHDVVEIGQKVRVRVLEVDDQKRLNLSMLFGDDIKAKAASGGGERRDRGGRSSDRGRGRGRDRRGGYAPRRRRR